MERNENGQFIKGGIPHNKKDKIELICKTCGKKYYRAYWESKRTSYCSIKCKRIYTLNENIFENINTEEKAYWLGFILADGSIYKRTYIRKDGIKTVKQSVLKISLQEKDKQHIIKFCNFLETNMPIKEYIVGNGVNDKKSKCCEIAITSKKIVGDLEKLGVGIRKSHSVKMPKIRDDLIKHMIRGIWDGDGSVLYRPRNKKYPNNFNPSIQICGNENILDYINNLFEQELNIKPSKLSGVGSIFLFRKSCSTAKKIVEYLYKNSNVYLNRKYENALYCMNWTSKK